MGMVSQPQFCRTCDNMVLPTVPDICPNCGSSDLALTPAPSRSKEPSAQSPVLKKQSVRLTILLACITMGIYVPVWFLARRGTINALKSPERETNAAPFVLAIIAFAWWAAWTAAALSGVVGVLLWSIGSETHMIGGILFGVIGFLCWGVSATTWWLDFPMLVSGDTNYLMTCLHLLGWLVLIVQSYRIRRMILDHFNGHLGHSVYMSKPLVFLFGPYYLQYKINCLDYNPCVTDVHTSEFSSDNKVVIPSDPTRLEEERSAAEH